MGILPLCAILYVPRIDELQVIGWHILINELSFSSRLRPEIEYLTCPSHDFDVQYFNPMIGVTRPIFFTTFIALFS